MDTQVLILSDSHQNMDRMQYAAEKTHPDVILHLGDHIGDAQKLRRHMPGVAFYMVKGNCDFQAAGETEMFFTLDGVKIYMTHGHIHGVKNGLHALITRANELGANLALYGHTHIAMSRQASGLWLMCPGQMERHDDKRTASYGIVTIADGKFECVIERLPNSSFEPVPI